MYEVILSRAVIRQLILGVILAAVCFVAILLVEYDTKLSDAIPKLNMVKSNMSVMRKASVNMEKVMSSVEGFLPKDYYNRNHRELMLLTLREVQKVVNGPVDMKKYIIDNKGILLLPVEIEIPADNYAKLIGNIGYLMRPKFPYFVLERIRISRVEDQPHNKAEVKGMLKMPVKKL